VAAAARGAGKKILCDIELLARAEPKGTLSSALPAPTANRRPRR